MKKIIFFVIVIIFLFIINNFSHSIYGLWQKQDLITEAKKELAHEQQEHTSLTQQLRAVTTPSYIEEEARNKLLLVKPGEAVVVLPQPTPTTLATQHTSPKRLPPWQQWYQLLF
jgi:cell division protein FtsB